jgi:hypothetical protein
MSFGSKKTVTVASEDTSLANPITFYTGKVGKYPANSQIWWAMVRPPEVGTDRPPKQYLEIFDPALRHQIYTGNTPAPKGHFVLTAFYKDRSSASGIANLTTQTSNGARPQAVAFYAGRVFYGGVFASEYNTRVYFSQILERPEQSGECYQSQDPTAQDLRDLLPSDGGVLVIPEAVHIYHMAPVGQDLYVFGSNGVWRIGGSSGVGFLANDYSVSKIAGTPALSNLSFVDVEGIPVWWNRSSINTFSPDQNGVLRVVSLTDETIKTWFNLIPEESKYYAKGTYDPLTGYVQWLYRSTEASGEDDIFNYDRVLVLDTKSGAFSPWSLTQTDRITMKGIFTLEGKSVEQYNDPVYVGTDEVLIGTDPVVVLLERRKVVQSKVKYIVNVSEDQ